MDNLPIYLWLLGLTAFVFLLSRQRRNKNRNKESRSSNRGQENKPRGHSNLDKKLNETRNDVNRLSNQNRELKAKLEKLHTRIASLEERTDVNSNDKVKEPDNEVSLEDSSSVIINDELAEQEKPLFEGEWTEGNTNEQEISEWYFLDARDSMVNEEALLTSQNEEVLYLLKRLTEEKAEIDIVNNKEAWVNALQVPHLYVDPVCKYTGVATSKQRAKVLELGTAEKMKGGWKVVQKIKLELH